MPSEGIPCTRLVCGAVRIHPFSCVAVLVREYGFTGNLITLEDDPVAQNAQKLALKATCLINNCDGAQ